MSWGCGESKGHFKTVMSSYCVFLVKKWRHLDKGLLAVVYFDQRTHASACFHMVENNEKHLKNIKKYFLSVWSEQHPSAGRSSAISCYFCTWASQKHDKKHWLLLKKSTLLIIFKRFLLFSTMQTHAQACVCRLKYTTLGAMIQYFGRSSLLTSVNVMYFSV